jgi:hypothetical protein
MNKKIQIVAALQKHHTRELSARLAELLLSGRGSYRMFLASGERDLR